jgi:hypothetical protein
MAKAREGERGRGSVAGEGDTAEGSDFLMGVWIYLLLR